MVDHASGKKPARPKARAARPGIGWGWIVIGVLLAAAIGGYLWLNQDRQTFELQGGEKNLLVLIRNEKQGFYRVRYSGRQPIDLRSLRVMLAGQVLHVDVKEVTLLKGEQEVSLNGDGSLPEGSAFSLAPGEAFEVRVTFQGQTLGGNYLYGFRIGYDTGGRQGEYELVLEYQYAIVVE